MRSHFVLLIFATMGLLSFPCPAEDDLGAFYSSLRCVFTKHYRAVTASSEKETMTFSQDTRLFMIHEALKTGEWQGAREQRGPKKGGIYCEIVSEKGPYRGAAAVPQTFSKIYFSTLLLAPYSKRSNRHLHVLLSYPTDVSKEFLQEFEDAVNRFDDY